MKHTFFLFYLFMPIMLNAQKGNDIKQGNRKPFVLGEIREIPSAILLEKRTLNIYLPEGYQPNDTVKYPVIYLLDGSADEDFIHIVGLVQFMNFSWVNVLPKSILIGIANVDRKRDFSFPTTVEQDKKDFPTTGGSEKFISFIEQELQPFIEKNYATNKFKTIIGQSFGGLLATEILFKKPTLFNNYIVISPSLWWDNESLLSKNTELLNSNYAQKTAIYIGVGKEGRVMETDAKQLVKKLGNANCLVKTHFGYFPNENHATIFHQAVYQAFETLNKAN